MQVQELIAAHLNVVPNSIAKITELYRVWCVVVVGRRPKFVSKLQVLDAIIKQPMRVEVQTGSEWHTTERRGAMVTVDGVPIYQALKGENQEWELVGNKGRHGKWCTADYELPVGARIEFTATANGKKKIIHSFVVGEINPKDVDFEGYKYANRSGGYIVSL